MRRRGIETVKTLLIIALAVSAVALILQIALFQDGTVGFGAVKAAVKALSGGTNTEGGSIETAAASLPAQVAVMGENGRYAAVRGKAELEDAFSRTSALLSEAMGSASEAVPVDRELWQEALGWKGIYYAYDAKLPVNVLAQWLSARCSHTFAANRYLVACDGSQTVTLFYSDGEEYYSCTTSALPRSLGEHVESFRPNGARFGFEMADVVGSFGGVDPCSLVVWGMNEGLDLYSYRGVISTEQYGSLMELLALNPYAEKGYVDKDGWDVYLLSGGTLRIRADGQAAYRVTETGAIDVLTSPAGSLAQLIELTRSFTAETVGADCADADVFLSGLEEDGARITLTYSYYLDGMPAEGFAARYEFEDFRAVKLELSYRVFFRLEEQIDILQPQFAAATYPSDALSLLRVGYESKGRGVLGACWTVR